MTVRSSSFGGDSIPLGAALPGGFREYGRGHITDGDKEYLRLGITVPYAAKYDPFLAVAAKYSEKGLPLRSIGTTLSAPSNIYPETFMHDGTRFKVVSGTTAAQMRHSSDGVNWTDGTSSTNLGAVLDICKFGNQLLCSASSSPWMVRSSAGSTDWGAISGSGLSVALNYLAAKDDATLVVGVRNTSFTSAGSIYTCTDGINWTSRTGTGATTLTNSHMVHWSPAASAFLHFARNANTLRIIKAPNGYTATAQVDIFAGSDIKKNAIASSPTCTVFSAGLGILYRTTDGENFAAVRPQNTCGLTLNGTNDFAVTYDAVNGVFWAMVVSTDTAGMSQDTLIYSNDDGITWSQAPYFYPEDQTDSFTSAFPPQSANGKVFWFKRSSSDLREFFDLTGYLPGTTPPNVIGSTSVTPPANADIPYLRIK